MRYEPHSFRSTVLDSTLDAEKARAQAVYDANSHKPIRRLGPQDFSGKALYPVPQHVEKAKIRADKARRDLMDSCAGLLRSRGPMTTQQIARELCKSIKAVSYAMADHLAIKRETVKLKRTNSKHYNEAVLWSLPKG